MENYSYPSYPDSHDSSPRSREIEFENPPPWDDQQPPPNYKAKFMCSYGGKIQPRPHDNQLSYVGGDTKILSVDRNVKFPAMISKLSAICDAEVTFKYQLPGEDLDALISVTNDDDLEHMMNEYDRLYRASAKPARMRLFLFPVNNPPGSFGSDREHFVEALNSGPDSVPPDVVKPALVPGNNVDFLFGLDKGVPPAQPPLATVKYHDPVPEPVAPPVDYQVRGGPGDQVMGSDAGVNPLEIQRQLQQELQRLQIAEQEHATYRRRSEDNLVGGYAAGDYYVQRFQEKAPPSNMPTTAPHPGGYWPEKQLAGEGYPTAMSSAPGVTPGVSDQQPVYVIPAPGTFYHAPPVMRPPAAPATQGYSQGYFTVQRMASDAYVEQQQVYSAVQPLKSSLTSTAPTNLPPAAPPPQQPVKVSAYNEGYNVVRPAGMTDNSGAYAQVAYDSAGGRHVYYTAPGGVVHQPPYQGVAPPVTADMRGAGVSMPLGQDVKVVNNKVSQGSV